MDGRAFAGLAFENAFAADAGQALPHVREAIAVRPRRLLKAHAVVLDENIQVAPRKRHAQ